MSLTCPYCEAEIEPCEESREPCSDIQIECGECEKTFIYQIEYDPCYYERKADCLNGGDHDYRPIVGAPAEYFEKRLRCWDCRHETLKTELGLKP